MVDDDNKGPKLKRLLLYGNALIDSMDTCLSKAVPDSVWKYTTYKQYARKYNSIVKELIQIDGHAESVIDYLNLDAIGGPNNTIAAQQQEIFEMVRANLAILRALLENKLNLNLNHA